MPANQDANAHEGEAGPSGSRMTGYPPMSPAHQPGGPRSLAWMWVLTVIILGAIFVALIATVWILGIERFFPSDP